MEGLEDIDKGNNWVAWEPNIEVGFDEEIAKSVQGENAKIDKLIRVEPDVDEGVV